MIERYRLVHLGKVDGVDGCHGDIHDGLHDFVVGRVGDQPDVAMRVLGNRNVRITHQGRPQRRRQLADDERLVEGRRVGDGGVDERAQRQQHAGHHKRHEQLERSHDRPTLRQQPVLPRQKRELANYRRHFSSSHRRLFSAHFTHFCPEIQNGDSDKKIRHQTG